MGEAEIPAPSLLKHPILLVVVFFKERHIEGLQVTFKV